MLLEVVENGLHTFLSNPRPSEGLWGRCDLVTDLRLHGNFDQKVAVILRRLA